MGQVKIIETDIPADKLFFRKRGWCGDFYQMYKVRAGDKVVIEKISDYEHRVFVEKEVTSIK